MSIVRQDDERAPASGSTPPGVKGGAFVLSVALAGTVGRRWHAGGPTSILARSALVSFRTVIAALVRARRG
ncbi:MAG: hypothetical protein ACE5JD_01810 [Candidatus Methylomirabilia bacterium]